MGTRDFPDQIAQTLFGKTRMAILSLLYGHADESFYLREIVRLTGLGLGAVQRELGLLVGAGILVRTVRGRQVYFQADQQSPVYEEIKGLISKTAGVGDVLRSALRPFQDRIELAFVHGSTALGIERRGSDIDILIVGEAQFSEIVEALGPAQERLCREVNPTVYPVKEFKAKLAAGHHFLKSVTKNPKLFVLGDENVLKRLATKRLAG
jgi:predicted nucleotidyltransferase